MDISKKIDDPIFVDLLTTVNEIAADLGIDFFIVGATARDIVLWYGFDIRPGRATKDVDIGVAISSWEQYDELKKALIETGAFSPEGDKQRMIFRDSLKLDVLPFGEIVDSEKKIIWQPDGDTELNLIGFEEAYQNSISVRVSSKPPVDVKIASATGLVLMKIFAWDDRKPGKKDAIDLGILIRSYLQVGNDTRLYEEHEDLLANENFDYELAGAHVLGRDLAAICEPETRQGILTILERELDPDGELPLVVQSAADSPQTDRTLEFWRAIQSELMKAQAESANQ